MKDAAPAAAVAPTSPPSEEADATTGATEPEIVYVDYSIGLSPVLSLDACLCGRDRKTHDARAIELASHGGDLPAVRCSCGRLVVGRKARVVKPRSLGAAR